MSKASSWEWIVFNFVWIYIYIMFRKKRGIFIVIVIHVVSVLEFNEMTGNTKYRFWMLLKWLFI